MKRFLVLFEDAHWEDLSPLTDLLPVPALAFGGSHLADRWMAAAAQASPGARLMAIEARPDAMAVWREAPVPDRERPQAGDQLLVANAAALPGAWLASALAARSPSLWVSGGRVAGALVPYERAAALGQGAGLAGSLGALGLPETAVGASLLRWPWDLVERNLDALEADLAHRSAGVEGDVHARAALYEPGRIAVGRGARVDAYAVLDARPGPIRLGEGVVVLPHTVVTGPCVVGAGTELLGGLVGRSTIGPGCRIAGEMDTCIWQGWSNKRHQGFVGHSVVSEWVNLGAMTTTSDLKNTYGPVRVRTRRGEVDSGLIKVGSFLGSHVRTGIGTLLPTGGWVGTASNLFGGGRFAPKHLPAFTWWDGEQAREHRLDRLLETARTAMARRGRPLRAVDEVALRGLFESTRADRAQRSPTVGPEAGREGAASRPSSTRAP